MAIRIITDSTSEITQAQAKELNITVVPMTVSFGNEVFTDGIDITPEEFYTRMRGVKELPKTSLINVATFTEVFEKVPESDEIIGIFISSELSGSLQSAFLAKENFPNKKIHLIDSRQVTFGLTALVHSAMPGMMPKRSSPKSKKSKRESCYWPLSMTSNISSSGAVFRPPVRPSAP